MTATTIGATADPVLERTILELLPASGVGRAYGILKHRLSAKMSMSEAEICKAVRIARLDRLITYCGFGDLKITAAGVERLQELIHHDMTRTAHAAANAALAEMGLPA